MKQVADWTRHGAATDKVAAPCTAQPAHTYRDPPEEGLQVSADSNLRENHSSKGTNE